MFSTALKVVHLKLFELVRTQYFLACPDSESGKIPAPIMTTGVGWVG